MSDDAQTLEAMNCEELLKELARLTSERDQLQAQVATPEQATPAQAPQVDGMLQQSERIQRIGELIEAKGCT